MGRESRLHPATRAERRCETESGIGGLLPVSNKIRSGCGARSPSRSQPQCCVDFHSRDISEEVKQPSVLALKGLLGQFGDLITRSGSDVAVATHTQFRLAVQASDLRLKGLC